MFNVLTHLKAFSIFMTLQILFVTYFSYLENCKRLKTWYQKIKITVASVQIIEENLFQWVHCKYLQGVIFAYFTHISLQLLLHYGQFWEFLSKNSSLNFSHCSCIFASISKNSKLGKQSTVLETLKPIIFKKRMKMQPLKSKFMP